MVIAAVQDGVVGGPAMDGCIQYQELVEPMYKVGLRIGSEYEWTYTRA